jgi:hypothetical protein
VSSALFVAEAPRDKGSAPCYEARDIFRPEGALDMAKDTALMGNTYGPDQAAVLRDLVVGGPVAAAALAAQGVGPVQAVTLPSAFPLDYSKLGVQLQMQGPRPAGTVTGASALIPAAVWGAPVASQIFHVDPVNGSNANTGLGAYYGDFTNAVKDVATAITKANTSATASRIVIDGTSNPWFTRATGAGTTALTVDASIESVNGRSVFTGSDAHTWALDGTFTACYSVSESNASGAIDLLNTRWLGEAQGARLLDRNGNGRQAFNEATVFASPTALNAAVLGATQVGYVNSGGKTYVKRGDGTVVSDTNTRVFRGTSTPAPAFLSTGSKSLYLAGCDFQGGFLSNAAGTRNLWLNNCRGFYAGMDVAINQNGFTTDFIGTALLTGCEGWACGNDVFNPHGVNGQHQCVTVDCLGWDTGRGAGTSNNGITGHESLYFIDLNGDYQLTRGGAARFINNSRALLFGTRILNDLGDGSIPSTAVMANDNAWMWAINCTLSSGRALYAPDTKARIFTQGNTLISGTSSGNVVPI